MAYSINQLSDLLLPELQDIATHLSIPGTDGFDKQRLIDKIIDQQAIAESKGANADSKPTDGDSEAKKRRGRPPKTKEATQILLPKQLQKNRLTVSLTIMMKRRKSAVAALQKQKTHLWKQRRYPRSR